MGKSPECIFKLKFRVAWRGVARLKAWGYKLMVWAEFPVLGFGERKKNLPYVLSFSYKILSNLMVYN